MIYAGATSVDITPLGWVPGIRLAGFGMDRKATGVLDTLEAGVLYLQQDELELLIVAVDSIGLMNPFVNELRDRLFDRLGRRIPVVVSSSHTHSAPDSIGLWGWGVGKVPITSGVHKEYMKMLLDRVSSACVIAIQEKEEARFKAVHIEIPDGWVRNDRKGGVVDTNAAALAVMDKQGNYKAVIVNFPAHPEILGEDNTMVSADYPGYFRRRIRDRKKGVPLFLPGAIGGMMTPNVPEDYDLSERKKYVKEFGFKLADLVLDRLKYVDGLDEGLLWYRALPAVFTVENPGFRVAGRLGLINRKMRLNTILSEVWHFGIKGVFQAVTCPGELTPELGGLIRENLNSSIPLMLVGLANDEIGYILSPTQYSDEEYSYEKSMSCGFDIANIYLDKVKLLKEVEDD